MLKNRIFGYLMICVLFGTIFSCSDEKEEEVLLEPQIDFSFSPEEPTAGAQVTFAAEVLTGSSDIVSWQWNFGFDSESVSDSKQATYVYYEAGSYDVTLTGTDASGKYSTKTKQISISAAPDQPFPASIIWSYSNGTTVSNPNDGSSSPAIGEDGTVYYLEGYAKENSKLVAVTDEGKYAEKKWDAALGFNLRNAPSIGAEGNIYIAAWSGKPMFKVSAENGSVIWNASTDTGISNSTAAIDSKGNIYIGTRAEGVFSWSADGNLRWNHDAGVGSGRPYYSSPVLSKDESTVYILMTEGEVVALNTSDGTPKWNETVAVSSGLGTSLSVDSDGTLYLTTGSEIVALTDNGQEGAVKWKYEVKGANSSGVVVGTNGDLYAGSEMGLISLKASDGSENWIYEAFISECVPAVDRNGNVYFGSVDGKFHILNQQGEKLIDFQLGDNIVNSPTIADNGNVYVEATDNFEIKLYKIGVEDSAPAESSWPMKGQNRKNTGVAK